MKYSNITKAANKGYCHWFVLIIAQCFSTFFDEEVKGREQGYGRALHKNKR